MYTAVYSEDFGFFASLFILQYNVYYDILVHFYNPSITQFISMKLLPTICKGHGRIQCILHLFVSML